MIKSFKEFINESVTTEYSVENFTPDGVITPECIQYVLDDVEDFNPRYSAAMSYIEKFRCGLRRADSSLFNDIVDSVMTYLEDGSEEPDEETVMESVEEIFG